MESKEKPSGQRPIKGSLLVRAEYAVFLVAMALARLVPVRLFYCFAALCGRLFFRFDLRHRNRAIQHLLHAGVAKTHAEAVRIGRRNFVHFGKVVVDIFLSGRHLRPDNIANVVTLSGSEVSRQLFFSPGSSRQAIIICAHFGNWEMAGPGYVLASGLPLLSVMRPFDNPLIGEYIVSRRSVNGHGVCDKKGAIRPLLEALKKGGSIAILPDQHAGRAEGVVTNFFGHPARTHASPALIHLKTGVPIFVMMPRRVDDDFHFEFIVSDPITRTPSGDKEADVLALAQAYTTEIEKVVARYPEQWMWPHRRWLDINRGKDGVAEGPPPSPSAGQVA